MSVVAQELPGILVNAVMLHHKSRKVLLPVLELNEIVKRGWTHPNTSIFIANICWGGTTN